VFVTPEYNHSTSGALKNAIDFLYAEWDDKAAGFVGYGPTGGIRAVEHLRLIMGELQVADVRAQGALSFRSDFAGGELRPGSHQLGAVGAMLDQVTAWAGALAILRPVPATA
jgi:NAD(P)H-dependent FMN reductase